MIAPSSRSLSLYKEKAFWTSQQGREREMESSSGGKCVYDWLSLPGVSLKEKAKRTLSCVVRSFVE